MAWQDRPYNRDEADGIPPVSLSLPALSRLTMAVMGTCLVLFLLTALTGGGRSPLVTYGALTFSEARAWIQPWRWLTYQYLHGGTLHLFLNMLAVYFFLPSLEGMWGWRKALAFYSLGGIAAGVVFGVMQWLLPMGADAWLIGASGSVLAAMGAVALLNPARQLILLIFPVPIRVGVALFGAFFLLSAIAERNLSNAAHLGGLAFGFFAPWVAGPWLRRKMAEWERSRLLREARIEQQERLDIDRILEKVHSQGMNSLTRGERSALKRATERQRKADQRRPRRV